MLVVVIVKGALPAPRNSTIDGLIFVEFCEEPAHGGGGGGAMLVPKVSVNGCGLAWPAAHCQLTRARPVEVSTAAVMSAGFRLIDRKSTRLNSSHRCISYA